MEKQVIYPIEFVKKPIEFVKKPISFIAKQKDEMGVLHEIEVDNPLLAGHEIPAEMTVKEYEEQYAHFIDEIKNQTSKHTVAQDLKARENSMPIIRERSEITELTNYELKPRCKRIYQDREGKIDYANNEIVVEITIKERLKERKDIFTIKCVDIEKITKIVGKKYPSAIIYNRQEASKVENDFREKTAQIPVTICYVEAGWQVIAGKHVYLHHGSQIARAEVMTSLNLPIYEQYKLEDIVNVWSKSLNLYMDYEVSSVLSVYSFLGVSYKLFEEAGFAPHFLLFLNGKTGSLKTTISKILYTQLTDEQFRDFPRRIDSDTQTSFERALVVSGRDTITLIDDYAPAHNAQKKNKVDDNLETIIRMVGDGSTKSRSNVELDDCRGKGVKGMVVLTGELRGKGLSSNLRCLYCELEREKANLETVSWFQSNKFAYTTLIEHFTRFLSKDWIEIVSYIKENIEKNRRKAEKHLRERRLVDTLATLWIMSEIIGAFLISYCRMEEKKVENEIEAIKIDMISMVVRSEMLSKEENPAQLFMRALITMIENKKIHITSEKLQGIELGGVDGFEDASCVYLLPDNVYQKVTTWLRMGGLYFNIDMNQIGHLLCDEGYAMSTSNGTNKKLYYARVDVGSGRKVKFLKIPKTVIKQLQENVE